MEAAGNTSTIANIYDDAETHIEGIPVPDWNRITAQGSVAAQDREITTQTDKILQNEGTINLGALMRMRDRGGQRVILELDRRQFSTAFSLQQKGQFRIQVYRHEDGSPTKQGDEFRWVTGEKTHYYDSRGALQPMNTKERESMMNRSRKPGDRHDPRIWSVHTLDKDRCIMVDFNQAMALLTMYSEFSEHPPKREHGPGNHYYHILKQVSFEYSEEAQEETGPKPEGRSTPKHRR
jgi:hypothetical protein